MADTLEFEAVSQTTGEVYDIRAQRTRSGRVRISCTCAAGKRGNVVCKHRLALLETDASLRAMVAGTGLLEQLAHLRQLEQETVRAKVTLARAKADFARALNGDVSHRVRPEVETIPTAPAEPAHDAGRLEPLRRLLDQAKPSVVRLIGRLRRR